MKRKRLNRDSLALTALIVAGGQLTAVGQDAAAGAQGPASLDKTQATNSLPEVVVRGQQSNYKPEALSSPTYTEPLRDVPQSVTVIPQAVIEEQNATTLRDVLRNVPGISIQAGEGGVPAGDNLSIRGFNARTDLFVDGIRDIGGYARDPFNYEQIEVVKGPASAYAGRGSTGGSLNLQTKTPKANPFYRGSIGFGTDDYKRVTFDVNQPLKPIGLDTAAVRLNAMWNDSEFPGRDEVINERWGIAPSFAWGLGTQTRLTLTYLHLEQDNVPDYGIPWVPANNVPLASYANQAPPVDFGNFYGLRSRDYENTVTDIPTLRLDHDFNEALSIQNTTRYGRTSRDSVITAPRFASPTSTVINRQIQSRDQVDEIIANRTDLTYKFESGIFENTVVPGVEYNHETSENFARTGAASTTDLFNPNPNDPSPGSVSRTGAKTDAVADSVGIYVFDTLKITEKWQVNGGLRWDHFNTEYTAVATNGVATTFERTDEMPSWRGALVFKPKENGSIYFGYGSSFNPSAEGLTLANTATAANNLSLDPEESQTFELGTKWDLFNRRLSLSAAIFRTEKTNARTEDPADPSDIVVLAGEQRVDGVEFGASGSITREWKVFGGYTWLASEVVKSRNRLEVGNELSNTPEHSANLWTTYDFPFKITIGAGMQYVGSRWSSTNPASRREAPDYVLFDALIAYSINEHATLRLNIYNLADEQYIDRVGGGHFVPGAGRAATLTANFMF
ncbi:MAG: TonB-dependent receptor [Verrucomicrobiales bacterium]